MKKSILIQSRLSSQRFPKKMMEELGGIPLAEFVYRRCATSKKTDLTAILTSDNDSDNELFDYCVSRDIPVFRGSLDNVLERYVRAAEFYGSSLICRVCGDSPFVDIELADSMFELLEKGELDYISPDKRSCVAGLDSETVTLDALKRSLAASASRDEFEHVTLHIKNNAKNFRTRYVKADLSPDGLDGASLTVDYPKDLALCNRILKKAGNGFSFRSADILDILKKEI